jgi:hypothetical protein
MLLLGNVGQQLDIGDIEREIGQMSAQLRHIDRQTADTLTRLLRENAELKLYLTAVTRLLVAKGVVTQPELASLVDAIDRSDGQADGLYSGPLRDGT